jgi:hypothetical protein
MNANVRHGFTDNFVVRPQGGRARVAALRSMKYLAQVELAWSQMHSRQDAYYLHKGRASIIRLLRLMLA